MSDFDKLSKSSDNEKKGDVVGVAEFPSDAESQLNVPASTELKRQLKNRHIAMIRSVVSAVEPPLVSLTSCSVVLAVSLVLAYSWEQQPL